MGLPNSASRSRNYTLTTNANQGGGAKKAGLVYQIGRSSWSSIFLGSTDPIGGKCCSLKQQMTMKYTPSNYQARNTGPNQANQKYFRVAP